MNKADVEKIVEDIAKPIVEDMNYDLVDVEFVKENNEWYLRLYIDNENGITLDDCTNVSRSVEKKLDEVDPINCGYYLEVSSPGLDRKLKKDSDFIKFSGKKVKINFLKAYNGSKSLEGILNGLDGDNVVIEADGNVIKVERRLIKTARLNEF